MNALDGMLVVALEQAVAAPYCTSRLAQAGARVIKIERPEGDFARGYDKAVGGQSSYFVWLNAGKESIALNLKEPDDLALLERMLARADVFVQNFAPGAVERLGLSPARLAQLNPRLITCAITGYGTAGDYAGMKAYDLLIQAESALCAVTGGPEAPSRVGVSVVDIGTGMQAYAAILNALIARGRDGRGRRIDMSMFDCTAEWMAVPLLQTRYGGKAPGRVGVAHPTIAPYGAFRARDGREVVISIQNEREWVRFADRFLGAGIATDPRFANGVARVTNRPVLDALVAEAFARLDIATLAAELARIDVAFGRLRTVEEALEHPVLAWAPVDTADGRFEVPRPGTGMPENWRGHVPAIDEHGRAIRAEFASG
jgi:crotonobetainyl-CoA:carnitine CoA-transferase CaiB-like acyl-CoA transferase